MTVGDITFDIYPQIGKTFVGGSSVTSAVWARRLGADAGIVAAVGEDARRSDLFALLAREGIDAAHVHLRPGRTSNIQITTDARGEKHFSGWDAGVLADFHLDAADQAFIADASAALLVLYDQTRHLLPEFARIRGRVSKIADFGDLGFFGKSLALVEEFLPDLDLVFLGLDAERDAALIDRARALARDSQKVFVVTLGARGSLVCVGGSEFRQDAPQVPVVDATGAGDSFAAGFIVEYWQSGNAVRALQRGTEIAARVIQQYGAI
jgi:sugar/nucleoside kinase (ribokinase family)